ncbi:hypothetical protein EB001_02045, partial [bacterium]|nr:hypothetical protein [bacterium]
MASTIKIKRSAVAGNPTTLGAGELAYSSLADNGSNGGDRLYIGTGTETEGNAANHEVIGGKFFTAMITAATNLNTISTLVKRDSSGNFAAGTITADLTGIASSATKWTTARNLSLTGDATATLTAVDGTAAVSAAVTLATVNSNVGTFNNVTVNGKGLVTAASNVSYLTSITASGDATGTSSGSALALTLATVNSNVGTFGSTTAIPVVTVNAKGLVTSVTTAAISSSL